MTIHSIARADACQIHNFKLRKIGLI